MSTHHIRQELSELEASLRTEIGALVQAQAFAPKLNSLSLTELIDLLAKTPFDDHPLFERLMRLDAALCQLDLGLYGLCSDCEAEIEAERLVQDPTEQRCHQCAEHYQHEHRHELRLNY